MTENNTNADPTKERLLIEAERLFAEKGFEAVGVREITAAAETNTAAINYHFGSKQNLYMEVFRQRWIPRATQNFHMILELQQETDFTIEHVIETFIRCFVEGPLSDHSERTIHSRLIHKELDTPTEAYEMVVKEVMAPFYEILISLIQRAMPGTSREKALFNCMSIFGQMVFFSHVLPVIERVLGPESMEDSFPKIFKHIYQFSVSGFKAAGDQS